MTRELRFIFICLALLSAAVAATEVWAGHLDRLAVSIWASLAAGWAAMPRDRE